MKQGVAQNLEMYGTILGETFMTNIYFPDEEITTNDLYFICYMIERVARKLHQRNRYVVNTMGKVYQRLIVETLQPGEDYVDGILRVYNNELCNVIDNYNCSAFYEPSYVIARAYQEGGF